MTRIQRTTPRASRDAEPEAERVPASRDSERRQKELADLADGLQLDQHALDEALIENGVKFHKIADAVALGTSRRDAAADELKEVEAQVDDSIRVGALKEEGGKKPSEDAIRRMITIHKDVIAARLRLRNREEELGRLIALKESYGQRSYAIKDLVSLHLAAYFGTTGKTIRRDVDQAGSEARHMNIRREQTDHRLRSRDEKR